MHIAIDARLIGETGVGRYIRNLIRGLSNQRTEHRFTVFLNSAGYRSFTPPGPAWSAVKADIPWHSVSEQTLLPRLYMEYRPDLLHVPYHNPPILYPRPFVVTIHDLTILHFPTGKASTLPRPAYAMKRLGYRLILEVGLRRARHILTVSESTKGDIIAHLGIPPEKITVTLEGVDPHIRDSDGGRIIPERYFLYVGNAYPHKNLETLLDGYLTYARSVSTAVRLVLVGADDYFYRRLRRRVGDRAGRNIVFFGPADDNTLSVLYRHAVAFVTPSRMEGFGLPALESLSAGTPVIASDIPVFREILGEGATFVDTTDPAAIAAALTGADRGTMPVPNAKTVQGILRTYSWDRMAKDTLSVYERSTRL